MRQSENEVIFPLNFFFHFFFNILTHCVEAADACAAVWFLLLGGGIGEAAAEAVLITEVNVSSNTSNGLLGLSSKGVSRSTLPESTLESR